MWPVQCRALSRQTSDGAGVAVTAAALLERDEAVRGSTVVCATSPKRTVKGRRGPEGLAEGLGRLSYPGFGGRCPIREGIPQEHPVVADPRRGTESGAAGVV